MWYCCAAGCGGNSHQTSPHIFPRQHALFGVLEVRVLDREQGECFADLGFLLRVYAVLFGELGGAWFGCGGGCWRGAFSGRLLRRISIVDKTERAGVSTMLCGGCEVFVVWRACA